MRRSPSRLHALSPVRRRGLTLVLTLWLVVLLVAMVYTVLWDIQVEVRLRRLATDDLGARWLAHAGVAKAIADLANDMVIERSEDNPMLDANGDVWAFDNDDKTAIALSENERAGTFTVRVEDAESRLNLNMVDVELLTNLFIVLGEEDEITARLHAEAVIDWRDENTDPVSDLAEPGFQERLHWSDVMLDEEGLIWDDLFHNARFVTIEELLMVPGITSEMFHGSLPDPEEVEDHPRRGHRGATGVPGLRDCVTTLSNGRVNINTARREVLGAIALTVLGTGADWEEVADAIIEQRDGRRLDDTDDDTPFQTVQELQNVPLASGLLNQLAQMRLDIRSQNFVITSTGRLGSARHTMVCEVRRDWEAHVRDALIEDLGVTTFELAQAHAMGRVPAFRPLEENDSRRSGNERRVRSREDTLVEIPAVRILAWTEN